MRVTLRAFARLRELVGDRRVLDLHDGARAGDVWEPLGDEAQALRESTRIARNGRVVEGDEPLRDGDEIALLPPVSGG